MRAFPSLARPDRVVSLIRRRAGRPGAPASHAELHSRGRGAAQKAIVELEVGLGKVSTASMRLVWPAGLTRRAAAGPRTAVGIDRRRQVCCRASVTRALQLLPQKRACRPALTAAIPCAARPVGALTSRKKSGGPSSIAALVAVLGGRRRHPSPGAYQGHVRNSSPGLSSSRFDVRVVGEGVGEGHSPQERSRASVRHQEQRHLARSSRGKRGRSGRSACRTSPASTGRCGNRPPWRFPSWWHIAHRFTSPPDACGQKPAPRGVRSAQRRRNLRSRIRAVHRGGEDAVLLRHLLVGKLPPTHRSGRSSAARSAAPPWRKTADAVARQALTHVEYAE